MKNRCEGASRLRSADGPVLERVGIDGSNSRFQTSPGLTAADTPKLALKWAFGFPSGNSAYGQPTVAGGRVFVGADTGFVYSLDASSGCVHWSFRADAGVRTAISVGAGTGAHPFLAYLGDVKGNVYAVDAETGRQVWKDRTDRHPVARVTGAPKLVAGRLYVPLSSLEESGAGNPSYPCCTFRGGVVAYDAVSGRRLWTSYTIPEAAVPSEEDVEGHAVVGTGRRQRLDLADNRSETASPVSRDRQRLHRAGGARLGRGRRLRSRHRSPAVDEPGDGDRRLRAGLPGKYRPNVPTHNKSETCPDQLGPDMDFAQAPMLRTLPDGRHLLVVGQKDGHVWALDPDKQGAVVWSRQVGLGVDGGGGALMWGAASDDRPGVFPITRASQPLGLAAVNTATGEIAWRAIAA